MMNTRTEKILRLVAGAENNETNVISVPPHKDNESIDNLEDEEDRTYHPIISVPYHKENESIDNLEDEEDRTYLPIISVPYHKENESINNLEDEEDRTYLPISTSTPYQQKAISNITDWTDLFLCQSCGFLVENLDDHRRTNHLDMRSDISDVKKVDQRNVIVPTSESKSKKYYCSYCKKMVTNFGRHVLATHHDLSEVKDILKYPKGSIHRLQKINKIRVKAQFLYNTEENTGSLVVKRRPNKAKNRSFQHYKHCPSCGEMYSKLSLRIHYRKCKLTNQHSSTNVFIESKKKVMNVHPKASNRLVRDILSVCKEDEIMDCFIFDELCIQYGNKLATKYRDSHNNYMVRQRLREMGRFLYEIKKINHAVSNLRDALTPQYYDDIVTVINTIAGLNDDDGRYRAPSTAYNLGLHIKAITRLLESECIKEKNKQKREDVHDLLCLMNEGFPTDINKTVCENQVENKRQKHVILPSNDDINYLYTYIVEGLTNNFTALCQEYSYKTWKDLAGFTLTSIQLFNRRRAGEIELIKIKDFQTFRYTDINEETMIKQKSSVRNVAKNFGRFFIRGKLNRTVPVILDKECVEAIKLILKFRTTSGVSPENPYVFGIEGKNKFAHLRACVLMRNYSQACGASNPSALRGTELRKHVATRCSMLELPDPLVERVANHMGHQMEIHKKIYRQPQDLEVPEMVTILRKCLGASDDHCEEDKENSNPDNCEEDKENSNPDNIDDDNEPNDPRVNTVQDGYSVNNSKDGLLGLEIRNLSSSSKRISWTSEEKHAVNTSFQHMIENNFVPTYEECNELRRKFPCLKARSPPQIKSFVAYMSKKRTQKKPRGKYAKKHWNTPEKSIINLEFKKYFESKQLPSLQLCEEVISKHPVLASRTPKQVKAHVNNVNKKHLRN